MSTYQLPTTPSPRAPFDMTRLQMNLPFIQNSAEDELDKLMGRLDLHGSQASPSPMPARRQSKDARGGHHARSHSPLPNTTATLFASHPRLRASELNATSTPPDIDSVESTFSLLTVHPYPVAPPTTPRRRARHSEPAASSEVDHLAADLSLYDVGSSPRKPSSARRPTAGPSTPLKRAGSGSRPDFASASPTGRWSPYACPRFPSGTSSESPSKRRQPRAVSDSAAPPFATVSGLQTAQRLTFASASPARCVACEFRGMGLAHAPLCPLGMLDSPPALSPAAERHLLATHMNGCPACDFPGVAGYTHSRTCGMLPPENAMDVDSTGDDVFGPFA